MVSFDNFWSLSFKHSFIRVLSRDWMNCVSFITKWSVNVLAHELEMKRHDMLVCFCLSITRGQKSSPQSKSAHIIRVWWLSCLPSFAVNELWLIAFPHSPVFFPLGWWNTGTTARGGGFPPRVGLFASMCTFGWKPRCVKATVCFLVSRPLPYTLSPALEITLRCVYVYIRACERAVLESAPLQMFREGVWQRKTDVSLIQPSSAGGGNVNRNITHYTWYPKTANYCDQLPA